MSTRRLAESVEGLSSFLALAAGDLWPKKCGPIYWPARSLNRERGGIAILWQILHKEKQMRDQIKCYFS